MITYEIRGLHPFLYHPSITFTKRMSNLLSSSNLLGKADHGYRSFMDKNTGYLLQLQFHSYL